MSVTGRNDHLVNRALAIAIDVISRAHGRHQPASDHDEMMQLYLARVPIEMERLSYQHGVAWLLAGGLDLREREPDPLPGSAPLSPEPAPGGGERIAA